jgi:phosphate binding protein
MRRFMVVAMVLGVTLAATAVADENRVRIKGSDTIGGELAPDWAEKFMEQHPGVEISVEALGSGTAFSGLLDGSAEIGASSRSVKPGELERARALGVALQEFVVGYDGIAVIVHPDNPVSRLTLAETAAIFSGATQRWSEVGGDDREIRALSRPSYSGTHSFFKDKVLAHDGTGREFARATEWVEENHDILRRVAADPAAVSYVGLGWVNDTVKVVAIGAAADRPALPPSTATVRDGSYPIYRPLLLYTRGEPRGIVREFVQFVLSPTGQGLVEANGFVRAEGAGVLAPAAAPAADGEALPPVRIAFSTGASQLDDAARKALARVAERLMGGGYRAIISGHADSSGPADANRRVSLARARAVSRYLVQLGVGVDVLTVTGEGADRPIATNTTIEGRQLNRRVDVQLVAVR